MSLRTAVLVVALSLTSAAARAQAPPLPVLPLDAYPGRTRDAVAPLYAAATARPSDAAAAGALGRMLLAWNQLEDAETALGRAQALAPKAFEWSYLRAVVLHQLARQDEAVEQFQRASALSPGYLPARVKLADALLKTGRLADGRRLCEELLAHRLTQPFAEYGLGQIEAAEGRHEAAVRHLQRAIDLFPEWGEAHYALALSLRRLGRQDDAERAMAARVKYGALVPGLDDPVLAATSAVRTDAVASLERGVKLDQKGDLAGAIAAHEAAVAEDPAFAQAHLNLILLHGRASNWAKVDEHYRKAVALGFGLADVNYNYGYAQELQGKWDLAEAAYRRSIDSNPQHVLAHLRLGLALDRRKDFAGAAAEFRLASDADSTSRPARFYLARALIELDQVPEAVSELNGILEPRDAETPSYLHALALAYARLGNASEATARATEARQLAVSFGQAELVSAIDQTLAYLKGARR